MSKPETIAITIYPAGAADDDLTVSDAMQQVLDTFELLSRAEAKREGGTEKIVWRLERASTNSPLTIEAVAISLEPNVVVDLQARQAKITFSEGLEDIISAKARPEWLDKDSEPIARRIFERGQNGIGRMDIEVFEDEIPPLILDHPAASRGLKFLDLKAAEDAAKVEDLTRTEHGSIDALLVGTTTHYGRPAIIVRYRLNNQSIKCVLNAKAAEQIGPQRNWSDVWSSQRALVRGKIHYNHTGEITLVEAEDLALVPRKSVSLSDIDLLPKSDEFDAGEYLDSAWGNGTNE